MTFVAKGSVLDSACLFVRNVTRPLHAGKCARERARAASPLVTLVDSGAIYWPISDALPATEQNSRLMEYAGQKVTAHGRLFERGGSHAIVIERIEAAEAEK